MWTLSGFVDEISPDFETQCAHARSLGLEYIEFRSAWDTNVLDLDDQQLEQAVEILDRHGLKVSSIGSPIGKIGIHDPIDPHLERARQAVDVAHVFGAPFVRIFSFFMPDGEDPDGHRDKVVERMRALADVAEEGGVTFLHENEKKIYGDIPRRCADILESVGSPRLRAAWDSANFVQCGLRPYSEGYAQIRPYLEYVQVKDAHLSDGEVVVTGEGDGELRETLDALVADGFDGFFSLEPHLSTTHELGGFSGPELFTEAHTAFTNLLKEKGIRYQ
ncbi:MULTISPECIES: sugar phosphate isomerase/epimerase family protein [Micrococcaceae]|uniref:sugar phosphate isomerase/epimerase family protein n=1 Tax=unclassified Kocuria TaxID=2649579 RepID=UPI001011968B|nr:MULTISPECIES: sugar phosphate isomerase/epimerase family protein [unclassified Kocuria]